MNQTQKRSIRMMLKKMSVEDIVKKTRFTRHQVSSAQFNYFTYSDISREIILLRTKDEFSTVQDSGFKRLQLIEDLTSFPQDDIDKYWAIKDGQLVIYRLGDYLPDIYSDLTNTETV